MDAGFLEAWTQRSAAHCGLLASCGKEFKLELAEFTVRKHLLVNQWNREKAAPQAGQPPP